jgi:hypothetical protein
MPLSVPITMAANTARVRLRPGLSFCLHSYHQTETQ